jgi:hypothetical protein
MRAWLALLPALGIIAGTLWAIPRPDPDAQLAAAVAKSLCVGEP